MKDNLTFGERLRFIRKRKNMSQKELSEKTGLYQIYISNYENDKGLPTCTTLEWLCKALDVSASELLGF